MSASPFSLEGKTVLVTGASSGVGRATAIMASQMGACVVITGRNEERLRETLSSLQGQNHQMVVEDLASDGACERIASQSPELDGLVYAAGVAEIMPFRMINSKHIERVMQLNFNAPMLLTQGLLRLKKFRPDSSLVFVTATADHVAPRASAIYSGSKAALTSAVKSMALELAKIKIRANCLSPGYVRTPMLEKIGQSMSTEENLKYVPLGLIEPEEIAGSAMYLLSRASRWVTRSVLVVDGGVTISVR